MRVGIDCRSIQNKLSGGLAGIGYYTKYLVSGLIDAHPDDEFVLFFEHAKAGINGLKRAEIFRRGEVLQRTEGSEFLRPNTAIRYFKLSEYRDFLPVIYSHIIIGGILREENLDVFHGPANIVPLGYRGKTVITIHDLAIYKHPEWFPGGQFLATKFVVPQSVRHADKIIAVSEVTKKDILEIFQVGEQKVAVVPNGADLSRFNPLPEKPFAFEKITRKYKIPGPYILTLGTLEPRKNLVRLIEAYWQMLNRNPELGRFKLVLAGGRGWLYEEIFEAVRNRKLEQNIIFTGYVADEDVPSLMQAAEIFVFPSLYEGFGLPVLEALACGTPVACSETSALPEVGGVVPSYFNPEETEDLSMTMQQLLTSEEEKQRQRELGPKHAQKFTWAHTAESTYKVYKEVL